MRRRFSNRLVTEPYALDPSDVAYNLQNPCPKPKPLT